jgi:hypothetical protein
MEARKASTPAIVMEMVTISAVKGSKRLWPWGWLISGGCWEIHKPTINRTEYSTSEIEFTASE